MKPIDKLLRTRGYWMTKIQSDLYSNLKSYMKTHNLSQNKLAAELGFSKGYISQVFAGDHDHKISKLVDLALSTGKAPLFTFVDLDQYIEHEKSGLNDIDNNNSNPITVSFIVNHASDVTIKTKTDTHFFNNDGDYIDTDVMAVFSQETKEDMAFCDIYF